MNIKHLAIRKKIKPFLKTVTFFGSVIVIVVGGTLALSPHALLAQTGTTFWNVERDGTNNLNFYLTNNGSASIPNFYLTADGTTNYNKPLSIKQGFSISTAGYDSGLTGDRPYQWGYQEGGAWSGTFPDLILGYHTGVKIGANTSYGGVKFFNDHPSRTTTQLFSVGDGDQNVRVANWLDFPNGNSSSGISSPTNSAKLFPNDGTYGAWKITGNRSGWGGIEFGAPYNAAQGISLMVGHTSQNNSNVYTGFYMNGVGWLWYGVGGGLYASNFVDKDNGTYYADPNATSQFNTLYRGSGFNGPEYDANNTGYYVDPNSVSQFSSLYRAAGFNGAESDANNGGYYVDPNGTSQFNNLYRAAGFNGVEYDINNGGYYVDPNGTSIYNDLRANIFYDNNNTGFYVDPNYISTFNDIRPYVIYDGNNTGYYLNPDATSNLNRTDSQNFHALQNDSWMPYLNGWNYFRGPTQAFNGIWYDESNNGYYVDPNSASNFYTLYRYIGFNGPEYDANHGGYYSDPSSVSRVSTISYDVLQQGSDIRFKKNVEPITNGLDKILKLRAVSFEFRKERNPELPDGKHLGYIAQEVEPIVPEIVHEDKDGYKFLEYQNLVPVLSKAIQEQQDIITKNKDDQQAQIDQLKQEVEALKAEIKALKTSH